MNLQNYNSSRQSTGYSDYFDNKEEFFTGSGGMFIDDFTRDFSLELNNVLGKRDFFFIEEDHKLKKLLLVYRNDFLRYGFDKVLKANMNHLIRYGKAFVEIVKYIDENGELRGVGLEPFRYNHQISFLNNIYYQVKTYEGKIIKGKISKKDVIVFKLTDLNYPPRYFVKIIKKLSKLDLNKHNLFLDSSKTFDLKKYKRIEDKLLLKYTKDVYWDCRKYDNQFVNDPYLLYRHIKYKLLKKKFLDYFLDKYNAKLAELGKEYEFSGSISYPNYLKEYEGILNDLFTGKKSRKEISDIITKQWKTL